MTSQISKIAVILFQDCECDNLKQTVTARGVLVNKVSKQYASGFALKLTIYNGGNKIYTVVFEGSALFRTINNIDVGDTLYFKGLVKKEFEANLFIHLFHAQR